MNDRQQDHPSHERAGRTLAGSLGALGLEGPARHLALRLGVVITAIIFVCAGLYLAIYHASSQENVRNKVLTEARTLSTEMSAVWDYIDASQTAINHNHDGTYDFKGIYCAVAGKGIARRFTRDAQGYAIRYVRDNPRTAGDNPDDFEATALSQFASGGAGEYYGFDDYNGEPVFRYVSELRIKHNCLTCHGEPAGEKDEVGFIKEGMALDDLAGAVSVVIPVASYESEAAQSSALALGVFTVLAAAVVTAVYLVLRRMVIAPVNRRNIELKSENQSKSELLATMGHELRTPLASIMAFTDVWERSDYPKRPEEERLVREIRDNSNVLLGMVNDTLDVARLEAGRYELHFDDVDVCDVVNAVFSVAEPIAVRKGIELVKDADARMPVVRCDWEALRKILLNLVSNALKFTPKGGTVRVTARLGGPGIALSGEECGDENDAGDGRPSKTNVLFFQVSDTGCGIAEGDRERIFQKYERPSASTRRWECCRNAAGDAEDGNVAVSGSGLGLYLLKNLTERLGGSVGVESEVGLGSTFTVRIPVELAECGQMDYAEGDFDGADTLG